MAIQQRHNTSNLLLAIIVIIAFMTTCSIDKNKPDTKDTADADSPLTPIARSEPIMVFAAASLTDVMEEMEATYESTHHTEITLNMASSGTLARQMEQGAQPDLFLSASKKWVDYVEELGLTQKEHRVNIAENDLVLIAPNDSPLSTININDQLDFASLLGSQRLSMGDPAHVPAGKYAKEALAQPGWYSEVKDKLLPAKDVRSALMVVEMGEAPLGIVYKTDAMKSSKVKVLGTFPDASHKPIVYVATICSERMEAIAVYDFLQSQAAAVIWQKYGFKK